MMDFIDLKAQQARIFDQVEAGIRNVLAHGQYILGPEVQTFEKELSAFGQADHAISCANGTDAILLPLMVWKIGPGDAVFCPSFTYCATAEVIALKGATPIFVDIDRETYNMDPNSLKQAIHQVQIEGQLKPRAVIAVDLFGQPADYRDIAPIAREAGLKLIADCAQAFGCTLDGYSPLHWCDVLTTSFFPAKPLGCYGDGGALLTNDAAMADAVLSLRFHGRGEVPGDHKRIGLNSRLDTIQAAILLAKLSVFSEEIEHRNRMAERYSDALKPYVVRTPTVVTGGRSTWGQYTIEVEDPAALQAHLKASDIPSARYYPLPVHKQTAYSDFPVSGNGLPNTEAASHAVISLPMHADLSEPDQDRIINAIKTF